MVTGIQIPLCSIASAFPQDLAKTQRLGSIPSHEPNATSKSAQIFRYIFFTHSSKISHRNLPYCNGRTVQSVTVPSDFDTQQV